MKVNELMVGDWVNYKSPSSGKLQPVKIKNIYGVEFNCEVEDWNIISGRSISDTEPIELTEEILVKNGFEKRIYTSPSNNEDYRYYQWNPTPEYPDEGVWLWPDGDSYTYNSRISDIKINSVHQLQHLLRLVGVQKEIEL